MGTSLEEKTLNFFKNFVIKPDETENAYFTGRLGEYPEITSERLIKLLVILNNQSVADISKVHSPNQLTEQVINQFNDLFATGKLSQEGYYAVRNVFGYPAGPEFMNYFGSLCDFLNVPEREFTESLQFKVQKHLLLHNLPSPYGDEHGRWVASALKDRKDVVCFNYADALALCCLNIVQCKDLSKQINAIKFLLTAKEEFINE